MDYSSGLLIDFDNSSDSEATVVTITGPDQHNLLLRITGALNSLGLNVKSASISVGEDNTVFDVFRIVGSDDKKVNTGIRIPFALSAAPHMQHVPPASGRHWKVHSLSAGKNEAACCSIRCESMQIPESQWEDVRNSVIQSLAGSSSRSSKPAIFGAAPAPDDGGPRRPLGSAREGDTVALEVAAAEMAHSAAMLVAIERTIMALSEKGVRCPRLSDLLAEKAHTVVSGPLLKLAEPR